MGDRLRAGILPRYVTKPTRSTQPCIPLGSLNRVPALIGWGNGGNFTSTGWQVTLCDPIFLWHVSSCSGVVLVAQTAIRFFTLPYLNKTYIVVLHAGTSRCVGRVTSGIYVSVCVRALREKPLELSTPNVVHIYSMAGTRHAVTIRSKGQRSRSHSYENRHGCTVTR